MEVGRLRKPQAIQMREEQLLPARPTHLKQRSKRVRTKGENPIKAVVEVPYAYAKLGYSPIFRDLDRAFEHAEKWQDHLRDIAISPSRYFEDMPQIVVWGWQKIVADPPNALVSKAHEPGGFTESSRGLSGATPPDPRKTAKHNASAPRSVCIPARAVGLVAGRP